MFCFISPNSNWVGYKGILALHISIWLGINFQWYTSYLFWWEIETIFNRYPLETEYLNIPQGFWCILNKLCWSFINNFILTNFYCRVEKLFYCLPNKKLPNKKEKEERDLWELYCSLYLLVYIVGIKKFFLRIRS